MCLPRRRRLERERERELARRRREQQPSAPIPAPDIFTPQREEEEVERVEEPATV